MGTIDISEALRNDEKWSARDNGQRCRGEKVAIICPWGFVVLS